MLDRPMRNRRQGLNRFEDDDDPRRPARSTLVLLLLTCATLITLDYRGGDDSPLEPARLVVGEVLGPAESVTGQVVEPFAAVPDWFRSQRQLRADVAALEQRNADLEQQIRRSSYDRNRLAEYDGLARSASDAGHAVVPARVIAVGPRQSFSHTVTIDAGTSAGVRADMTVLNADGLVGRVLRATRHTATVLLILDEESVVGGRIGRSMEVGFLRGRGDLGERGRLDLELVDDAYTPVEGDKVVTWGSKGGSPYVAGVPIGKVVAVFSSPRETAQRAVISPYVDFSSLDVVGVVVPRGTEGDRATLPTTAAPQGGQR